MLFNSLEFPVFLALVFLLYWRLPRRPQNVLLLVASYVFYGWWDWRFLSLILLSSLVDYRAGQGIADSTRPGTRKAWVTASVLTNMGALALFKYFNFFTDSLAALLGGMGVHLRPLELNVVLPVGISFYSFQTLSYTLDVYRGKIRAHRNPVEFFAFVSFFPQLVAGPIERAGRLLGQFQEERRFDIAAATDGCRQMLWGFFKKIVVADNLAAFVQTAFAAPGHRSGAVLLVGTFFFAIQIYCDFSGYSDIAIGCARLFGFRLMRNFAYPYFSTSIGAFWRRWHISLSTWFRDYVYIPLGGSRRSFLRRCFNILATFVLSGLWHGANWTFVVWGALHGLYYLPGMAWKARRGNRAASGAPGIPGTILRVGLTFGLVCIGWVFFRASSVGDAVTILGRIAAHTNLRTALRIAAPLKLLVLVFLLVEWTQRSRPHALGLAGFPRAARWSIYYALVLAILFFGNFSYAPFIYFQF